MSGKELFEAIKKEEFRGFYLALNGNICCNIGVYMISIFVNEITDRVEISIDSCCDGNFDNCFDWENVDTVEEAKQRIQDFILWCYNKTVF